MSKQAHDLFRLMLDLSQVYSESQIEKMYMDAVTNIFDGYLIEYADEDREDVASVEEISVADSVFGKIRIVPPDDDSDRGEELALLINSIRMLAVILDRLCKEKKLSREKTEIAEKQKITESELARSEEKFREMLESLNSVHWAADREGNLLFIGGAVEQIYGIGVSEFYNNPEKWLDCVHPEDREIVKKKAADVLGGKAAECEYRIITPAGETKWILDKTSPILDEHGEVVRIGGIADDITTRKNAELSLRDSEEFNRQIVKGANDGVIVYDSDLRYRVWNPKMEEISGIPAEEVIGKYTADIFPFPVVIGIVERLKKAVRGEPLETVYFPVRDEETGKSGWLEDTTATLRNIDGEIIGAIVIVRDISERKQMEESLKDSERRWSFALEGAGDGVWDWNVRTNEVFFSRKWKEMLGYSDEEITHNFFEWEERLHPDDREQTLKDLNAHLDGKTSEYVNEQRLRCKDGSYKWILDRGKVLSRDEQGNPLRVIGTHTDIDYRKSAEAALQESESKFRNIFDSSTDAIFIRDPGGRFLEVNSAACERYGYSKRELLQMSPMDLDASEFRKNLSERTRVIMTDGTAVFETVHKTKDNKEIYVEIHGRAITYRGGPAILSTVRDITQRRLAEEEIRRSEENYRSLFNSMHEGVLFHELVYDDAGKPVDYRILHANKTFEIVTGISASAIKGKLASAGYGLGEAPFLDIYAEVAETGKPVDFETFFPQLNKHFKISVFSHAKNQFITVFIDITERKDMEEKERVFQQQEQMAAIGKVAGKMAHDFNNVLGIIMGTSQLMLSDELPDGIREELDIILESAVKGRDITRNLLLFARDQEPKYDQFDLNERISKLIYSLKSELKSVAVNVNYGLGLGNFLADAGMLDNALVNLIQNSIHAMSKTEKPMLKIRAFVDGENVCIKIADNGCGIPAEFRQKIFDPTVSLKGSNDRRGVYSNEIRGSGYGLANVKRCVDKHGGKIEFTSEEGKGTTFVLSLPMIKGHFSIEEIETLREQDVVEGKRILLVEDEPHFGRILYMVLKDLNHMVDHASTGEMALDYFQRNKYDVISLDFVLPDMNGMDIYKEIRKSDSDVPVVFVSGNFEFMQSMIDLKKTDPRVDHLPKPFNNVDYVRMVNQWLEVL